jgi:hypothetical protein
MPARLNAVESSDLEAKEIIFLESICGRVDILALRLKQGSADRRAVALPPKGSEPKKGPIASAIGPSHRMSVRISGAMRSLVDQTGREGRPSRW